MESMRVGKLTGSLQNNKMILLSPKRPKGVTLNTSSIGKNGLHNCRDPSPWETRGTQLMETRGTCYQPDHHRPDSPKDMHVTVILSGPPQGKANDVSASPIQGRANDAGRT